MIKTLLRYIVTFLIILLRDFWYLILSKVTIWVSYGLLFLYLPIILVDNSVIVNSVTFEFIEACIAVSAYLIFVSLALLTRNLSSKRRVKIIGIGLLSIFIVNILRIQILINVYFVFGKNYFDSIHLLFWHILSSVFVFLLWVYLTKRYKVKSIPVYTDLKYLLKKI
jgi:exosortase/archaeosortase family protein